MQLTENTTFANRYHLVRLLGRGGFSEVWLAKDSLTDLEIALKVYAPGTGMDEDGLKSFSKELAAVYDLNHGNLLKPQHVDSWQGMPYLVMSYCSQGSLVKRIGKMTEEEIWKVLYDVASGLAYLHERDIVHQDIKPDNILVDNAGNYVITDFGISTRARSTLRKSVAASSANSGGTIAYMGPERFGKEPTPIKASDIWSLGAMLFELMTGETPFGEHGGLIQKSGAEIPAIQGDYSDCLKSTVEKMLSLETWNRPTASYLVESVNKPSIKDESVTSFDFTATESTNAPQLLSHQEQQTQVADFDNNQTAKIATGIADFFPETRKLTFKNKSLLWFFIILFIPGAFFSVADIMLWIKLLFLGYYPFSIDWWWNIAIIITAISTFTSIFLLGSIVMDANCPTQKQINLFDFLLPVSAFISSLVISDYLLLRFLIKISAVFLWFSQKKNLVIAIEVPKRFSLKACFFCFLLLLIACFHGWYNL